MAGKVLQGAESFLGHSSSTSSGGFLDGWKDDGEVEIVLHPRAPILALWIHRWNRIGEDKEKKLKIFPLRFNSMEDEKILKKQHFRNDDGSREYPPKLCPFSLTLEWVREQIEDNHIDWTDEIFRFDTPRETLKILAGGFTGLFQSTKLTDEQLKELSDANVARNLAYKQNARCSLNYAFCVVNVAAPEEGAVTAMEGKTLGDKMKKAIRDETRKYEKLKNGRGDPFVQPYIFRWMYDDDKSFDDKYDVVALPLDVDPVPGDVMEILADDPPENFEKLAEPSNVALLRASFEQHWVHRIVPPWDQLFAAAEAAVKGTSAGEAPESFNYGANAKDEKSASKPRTERKPEPKAPAAPPPPPAEEEELECDKCQAVMKVSELTCKNCGAEYDSDGRLIEKKPEPPKEEPKRRSRSAAAAETKSPSDPAPAVATETPRRRRGS